MREFPVEQFAHSLRDCCKKVENLQQKQNYNLCSVCGAKHYILNADPIVIKSKF